MTKQQIFNKVVKHLRKQGKRAFNGITCWYRAPDGSKCAVGCLLKDDEYRADFEGKTVGAIALPERLSQHLSFLDDIQWLHDQQYSWKQRGGIKESAISAFARKHKLTVP